MKIPTFLLKVKLSHCMKKSFVLFNLAICFTVTACMDMWDHSDEIIHGKQKFTKEQLEAYPQLSYNATMEDFTKIRTLNDAGDSEEYLRNYNREKDYALTITSSTLSDFLLQQLQACKKMHRPKETFGQVNEDFYYNYSVKQDGLYSRFNFYFYETFSCFGLFYWPNDNTYLEVPIKKFRFYKMDEKQYTSIKEKINEIAGYDFI